MGIFYLEKFSMKILDRKLFPTMIISRPTTQLLSEVRSECRIVIFASELDQGVSLANEIF